MDGHQDGVEREYRKRRKVPVVQVLGSYPFLLIALTHAFRQGARWIPLSLGLLAALALLRWTVHLWRGRTLVGRSGIAARWTLTERRWDWHDVYDLRAEPVPNAAGHARKWFAYLYDTEGRRFLLPHLDDWQLDDVPGEVAALREAGARERGAAFERRAAVEELVRRRAGHRKAWQRAVAGGVFAFAGGFLVWAVLELAAGHAPTPALLLWTPLGVFAVLAALLHWRWESQVPRPLRAPGR
ncbi:hypothetical protein [Streptomyces sp. NPDC048720]|uniref:hypothetical protein n=1 Tax=Streptomyces sp. NPDC048720 TaxID=3365588 RepID=UPI003715753E